MWGSEGTVRSLLENHVLTVLADIRRKRLKGYPDTFAGSQGTVEAARYVEKLRRDIAGWTRRLETYLRNSLTRGSGDSPSAQTARELHDRLKSSLPATGPAGNDSYYRMLRTVTAIQENIGRYQRQAEESGDTEPALTLLIAYLKNYSGIAEAFNSRFSSLPELYLHDILHAKPKAAEPDNAYVVVTPTDRTQGFILPQGSTFPAGEGLTYLTEQEEYISPMRCVEIHVIRQQKEKKEEQEEKVVYKSLLSLNGKTRTTASPFSGGHPLYLGWQIESPLLAQGKGKQEISIRFRLTTGSACPSSLPADAVTLRISREEGWTELPCACGVKANQLHISFIVEAAEVTVTACTAEVHGTATTYPALRLLTAWPEWADGLEFDHVEMEVKASGIRNFSCSNELGEADLTQAVFPFGIQAEQGSRFVFSSKETTRKPLLQVELHGRWQKLPATRQAFDTLYAPYGIKSSDFAVSTACRQQDVWHTCDERQPLLKFDNEGKLDSARIRFLFTEPKQIETFRVTLESPAISFGTSTYRKMFTDVMIHNSRCKEKKRKAMPEESYVPQLVDAELSYTALAAIPLKRQADNPSCLGRITALAEQEAFPAGDALALPFLLPLPAQYLLHFAFTHAEQATTVRMYMDMIAP
ncbi:hypothetical protein [uncultured Parabacteroides sp.]|uniref:Uncharacterized protein n=2 Tax=Parabacteroides johnsonii TaxID=387661 RepID=K5Y350_9BACT|nr:hypothetical protein [uncultured Parabacteroides sp.]EKN07522.1 hypothetical protein HMPREF1077_02634 [Parabacteroides johnsonii CL02T12C29]